MKKIEFFKEFLEFLRKNIFYTFLFLAIVLSSFFLLRYKNFLKVPQPILPSEEISLFDEKFFDEIFEILKQKEQNFKNVDKNYFLNPFK